MKLLSYNARSRSPLEAAFSGFFKLEKVNMCSEPIPAPDPRRIYQEIITVGPESIDVQKHVNNREYLRWMEHAAMRHAASLGWDWNALQQRGHSWVAREHWIEYLRPSFEGDVLAVLSWVQSMRGPASLRRYAILRGSELIAAGATEWVYIDIARGRPVQPEADVRESFTLISPRDPELKALGVGRPLRFSPLPSLLGEAASEELSA